MWATPGFAEARLRMPGYVMPVPIRTKSFKIIDREAGARPPPRKGLASR
jgi:hypothetical protein